MKSALLLLNGERPSQGLLERCLAKSDLLAAADGAANHLPLEGITAEIILGDFDSLERSEAQAHPHSKLVSLPDQNKTDSEKALEYLIGLGYQRIRILGGLGGRQDHQLTHYHLLLKYRHQAILTLYGERDLSFVMEGEHLLSGWKGRGISLIPLFGETPVRSEGLRWELDGQPLKMGEALSQSNEFLRDRVTVDAHHPLLVILTT